MDLFQAIFLDSGSSSDDDDDDDEGDDDDKSHGNDKPHTATAESSTLGRCTLKSNYRYLLFIFMYLFPFTGWMALSVKTDIQRVPHIKTLI